MRKIDAFPETVFSLGPVDVSDTVITTWFVMAVIIIVSRLLTKRLSLQPSLPQEIVESCCEAVEKTVKDVLPIDPWSVVPVLGTLWIFIGFSNLTGLLPGLKT